MDNELDDIAWELGIPRDIFRKRFGVVRAISVSMWCCMHKDWKTNPDNPICLHCENEKLAIQNDELKRAIKVLQQKR